jgi:ribosomal protein L29
MKNHTGGLDDTSLLRKARRDVARIETLLRDRTNQGS